MNFNKLHSHMNAHVHERVTVFVLSLAVALVVNLLNMQIRALAQETAPTGDVTAPSVQPDTSEPVASPENGPSEESGDAVDPTEIRNTLRDIGRQRQDLRALAKQVTRLKLSNAAELLRKIKELDNSLAGMESDIDRQGTKEALQEYYDGRTWELVEDIRVQVELPRELKDIGRSIVKVGKLLKSKSFQKLGLDLNKLQQLLDQSNAAHKAASDAFNAGDFGEAREAMQPFWEEGMHPGGFEGALHRIRETKGMLNKVKDKQVLAAIEELLAPVYEALYEGDFNEVNNILDEYEDDLRRLINVIIKSRLRFDKAESRLSKLEELISQRSDLLEQQEQERKQQKGGGEQAAPAQ